MTVQLPMLGGPKGDKGTLIFVASSKYHVLLPKVMRSEAAPGELFYTLCFLPLSGESRETAQLAKATW